MLGGRSHFACKGVATGCCTKIDVEGVICILTEGSFPSGLMGSFRR